MEQVEVIWTVAVWFTTHRPVRPDERKHTVRFLYEDNDLHARTFAYLWVACVFAVVQAILSPLIGNMVEKNASAFSGGVGIVSSLVALFITNIASTSLSVSGGIGTWILAALVIWIFGAIAAFILPYVLVKRAINERRD